MSDHDRLRRLVGGETDDPDGALEQRLTELDDLDDRASEHLDADLRTLEALSGRTRFFVVRLLVAADEGLAVAELDAVLEVSQSAVSHALAELVDAGLVERRNDGTWRLYTPTDRARRLLAALDEVRE